MQMLQTIFQPVMDLEHVSTEDGRFRLKASGGGFFAKLFGLGTKVSLVADSTGFQMQKFTFGVEEHVHIPRTHIASTVRIISKPVELLVLGLITLPLFGFGLILLLIYFFSKRRIILGVVSSGGTVESIKLKADEESLREIRAGMKVLEGIIDAEEDGTT